MVTITIRDEEGYEETLSGNLVHAVIDQGDQITVRTLGITLLDPLAEVAAVAVHGAADTVQAYVPEIAKKKGMHDPKEIDALADRIDRQFFLRFDQHLKTAQPL